MTKTIRSGNRLRYPITIVRLEKASGDRIKKGDTLFQYSFKWMREVGDFHSGDTWQQEQTTITDFPCPVDGKLQEWRIKEGDVIPRDQALLDAEEDCSHEIQVHGLCAICGKDMTEVSWATDSRDTDRAPINMTHDQTSLLVSKEHAQKAERELQSRLLEQRKLSLVVDLDQTIIHACIEPTIGDWQRDPNNPNYEALKDVKSFQLSDDGPRGLTSGCWYYIKLRPGLEEFLNKVASNYELHVYTMGTRTYAQNIAKLVDPQGKLFGNRVISRDENGNMTAKSLQRLFPVSTNMVVIIDDRSDVWPRNRPNLIKVTPYDFFKGVGDINSSFLPQRADLLTPSPSPSPSPAPSPAKPSSSAPEKEAEPATSKPSSVSPVADLVAMSGADDPALAKRQTEEQARELEKQIKERPLLHMQEKLDKEDEEAEKSTPDTENGDYNETPGSPPHHRHRLLLDNDHELPYLEQHLTALHKRYYEEYDRVASQSSVLPDVGKVLDSLKAQVLKGTRVVLSGLVPIGVDVRRSEIGLQVSSFGAELRDRVSRDITHLVVSSARPRTQKVRQAARFPSIKIVNQDWLAESLTQWQRVDEEPYLVVIHPADRRGAKEPGSEVVSTENTDTEPVSDADDTDDTAAAEPRPLRIKPGASGLQISLNGDVEEEPDSEDDDIDEDEEGLMPSDILDGQLSPVDDLKTFDWDSAGAELQDFLGSDDDDDEDDGDGVGDDDVDGEEDNDDEKPAKQDDTATRKRKHGGDDDDGSEADSVDQILTGSSKKQRLSADQPASNHVVDNSSSLPTPQITGDEQEINGGTDNGHDNNEFEIDDADFEADLEAELEKEFADEFDEEEEDAQQTADVDESKAQNMPSEKG